MSSTRGDNNNDSTLSANSNQQDVSLKSEAFSGELDSLRLQANQFNQLFDVMPAGVVIIDGDGIVIKANKVANELLKVQLLDVAWIDIIKQAFKPRADDGHEVSLLDGRRVKFDVSSFGSQAGQLILITDLTETRLLQDKLSQMQRLSALGRMVSTLAHQIRTPLSAAILYCSNLSSKTLSAEKRERFQGKLSARLHDLEQQVNDMLLFAKSGGRQVVTVLKIPQLIEDAIKGCETQINEANAKLSLSVTTGDLEILGNKNALEGALQNLIHNALQVNRDDIHIQLNAFAQDNCLFIHVIDNGEGIDEADVEKIFEPFYTSKVQGTGLGLAVVKSVAKAHHGDVKLITEKQSGANFCIKLPLFQTDKID